MGGCLFRTADINHDWLQGVRRVGVTAGASAPEVLVQAVIEKLNAFGGTVVTENPGVQENTVFEVPAELRIRQID